MPTAVAFAGTASQPQLVYEVDEGKKRLKELIAPAPAGVTCEPEFGDEHYALGEPGCRMLVFAYNPASNWGGSPEEERLEAIYYHDATGSLAGERVAWYFYNSAGELVTEYNGRTGDYELYEYSGAKLTMLTPPGVKPWESGVKPWNLDYYEHGSGGEYEAKLKSVSRASLLEEGPETATTTIAYDVPLTGEDAPYDLAPSTVAEWGQTDYPVDATAVFPPTEVPGEEPSDYDQATVHYMDPEGREVNTASPAPPGVEGEAITTAEANEHGDVVRELGAEARLEALAAEDPPTRAAELDSHTAYTYEEDGARTVQAESWGPLHEVRLKDGETAEARSHTVVENDQGFTLTQEQKEKGETWPNLPTEETSGAVVPGEEGELEAQTTKTAYEWEKRLPVEQIVDPGKESEGHLNLITKTAYNSAGQVTEERQPSNSSDEEARTAGTTKTVYYTHGANAEHPSCGGEEKDAVAGLPCVTYPAAAPSPAGARPQLPWTWFTKYSHLDQPEETQEKTGGELKRTTTITYDAAGRQRTSHTTGEGTSVPKVETTYDYETGAPESRQFVCESSCEGFDQQQTRTEYDELGRPVKYFDADGNTSEVSYDLLGRPYYVSDGKGYQTISYDEDSGVVTEMTDSAAGTFKATYNADGQLTEQLLPNGLAQKISYDHEGTATGLEYEKTTDCSEACTWLQFHREDSIAGQVLREASTLGTHEYSYDKAGRLTLAKEYPDGVGLHDPCLCLRQGLQPPLQDDPRTERRRCLRHRIDRNQTELRIRHGRPPDRRRGRIRLPRPHHEPPLRLLRRRQTGRQRTSSTTSRTPRPRTASPTPTSSTPRSGSANASAKAARKCRAQGDRGLPLRRRLGLSGLDPGKLVLDPLDQRDGRLPRRPAAQQRRSHPAARQHARRHDRHGQRRRRSRRTARHPGIRRVRQPAEQRLPLRRRRRIRLARRQVAPHPAPLRRDPDGQAQLRPRPGALPLPRSGPRRIGQYLRLRRAGPGQ